MNFEELNTTNLESFLNRFNRCFDGLIDCIGIKYENGARWPNVRLSIQTPDEKSEDGWANLKLALKEVTNLKIVEGKSTYRVLSDGLILKKLEGKWGIGVDDAQYEAATIEAFSRSPFGFVASRVEWGVEMNPRANQ